MSKSGGAVPPPPLSKVGGGAVAHPAPPSPTPLTFDVVQPLRGEIVISHTNLS